jgi:GNAT superfamily N-acetyltransferase
MLTRPATDLSEDELSALVDRTLAHFVAHGRSFEWKTWDHDHPRLRPLLLAAGAEPEAHEALVLGEAAPLATEPVVPDGIRLRQVTERADLDKIGALSSEVWGEDWTWLAAELEARVNSPDPVHVFVAEDGDLVVSAAWLDGVPGTPIAGMWGGNTLAAYRGRGIYRALVAVRARLALELGHPILQVDASDDSRPILERLGLHVVGGTQPFRLKRSRQSRQPR